MKAHQKPGGGIDDECNLLIRLTESAESNLVELRITVQGDILFTRLRNSCCEGDKALFVRAETKTGKIKA